MLHHFKSRTTRFTTFYVLTKLIDLHVFKAITAASCVDIIVNKRLNKYN